MKRKSCNAFNIFIIFSVLAFIMIIYAFSNKSETLSLSKSNEMFSNKCDLIPSEKLRVYQGSTLPDIQVPPINFDNDDSVPEVDGKKGSTKSMFMMAFNKCDPSCCPSTYSCSGGCVCLTKDQKNFIGTRGQNNSPTKCSDVSEY